MTAAVLRPLKGRGRLKLASARFHSRVFPPCRWLSRLFWCLSVIFFKDVKEFICIWYKSAGCQYPPFLYLDTFKEESLHLTTSKIIQNLKVTKPQSHKASHFKILKFQKTQNLKASNSQSPKDSNHVTLPVLPLAIFFMSSFGPVASQASEYYQVILPIII